DGQTAAAVATVAFDVPDGGRRIGIWIVLEALNAAGEVEVEAGAVLWGDGRLVGEGAAGVDDVEGLDRGVGDGAAAVGGGEVEAVGDRAAPVVVAGEGAETVFDAEEAADVAGVAVGVPAGGVDDHQRCAEVVLAVEEGVDDEGVVGDHVAVAAV